MELTDHDKGILQAVIDGKDIVFNRTDRKNPEPASVFHIFAALAQGSGLGGWEVKVPSEISREHSHSARYGHPVVPEGWQLVPKVPTEEMMAAFADTASPEPSWADTTEDDRQSVRVGFVPPYQAMLESAPKFGEE